MCILGSGRPLYRASDREDLVEFLQFLKEHEEPAFTAQWVSFVLDSRTADYLPYTLWNPKSHPDPVHAWQLNRERIEKERTIAVDMVARYPR